MLEQRQETDREANYDIRQLDKHDRKHGVNDFSKIDPALETVYPVPDVIGAILDGHAKIISIVDLPAVRSEKGIGHLVEDRRGILQHRHDEPDERRAKGSENPYDQSGERRDEHKL